MPPNPAHNLLPSHCQRVAVVAGDMGVTQEETPQPSIVITHILVVYRMVDFPAAVMVALLGRTYLDVMYIALAMAATPQLVQQFLSALMGPELLER